MRFYGTSQASLTLNQVSRGGRLFYALALLMVNTMCVVSLCCASFFKDHGRLHQIVPTSFIRFRFYSGEDSLPPISLLLSTIILQHTKRFVNTQFQSVYFTVSVSAFRHVFYTCAANNFCLTSDIVAYFCQFILNVAASLANSSLIIANLQTLVKTSRNSKRINHRVILRMVNSEFSSLGN